MPTLQVLNPYNQTTLAELEQSTLADVEQALSSASQLAQRRGAWLPAYERIEILEAVMEIMSGQIEELTNLAASEGGKPYLDSRVEVERAINGVKLAIEYVPQNKGEQIPMGHTPSSANRLAFTQREPIGVVGAISAFNHPLNLIVHQTVPALAVGCPVIVKPAETTPLSCLRFVEILHEAGLPPQWCQVLNCDVEGAQKLATDGRLDYLSFIGSARVGWMLRSKLAPGVRCGLEHGGAAPVIVAADADWDDMIPSLAKGGFYHAGQVCVSVQRVFVQAAHSAALASALAEAAASLAVGDPLDPQTDVGPLILPREVERVAEWVEEARRGGAQVVCGGHKLSDTCYAPTVLLDPPEDSRIARQEIFGPVVCVFSCSSNEDALLRANALAYAFQASVFTRDLDTALDLANRLDATAVMVNDHTAFRVDWMPFGGRRQSGLGLGGIEYSMHEMSQEKMVVIKSDVL